MFLFLLSRYLGVESLGLTVSILLLYEKLPSCFPKQLWFSITTRSGQDFQLFHIFPKDGIINLLHFSHPWGCAMVSLWVFIFVLRFFIFWLHCRGFSLAAACGLSIAVHGLRWLCHTGLVAPQHVESSWTRDQTPVPCLGRWILIHCATRKVPYKVILMLSIAIWF